MSSKKRNNLDAIPKYNDSNKRNFTHQFEYDNASYNLPSITLEDLDSLIVNYFDKFFTINNKPLRLINGMISPENVEYLYPDLYNKEKETLISPYLITKRSKTEMVQRNNPSYKPISYVIPKMKAQGLVFEEWSYLPPINYNLTFEFIFITNFYDNINDLTKQLSYFFRNKRNILEYNRERFSIKPDGGLENLFSIETIGDVSENTQYVLTFSLVLECYTRDVNNTTKKERPNTYIIDFKVRDKDNKIISTDRTEIKLGQKKEK